MVHSEQGSVTKSCKMFPENVHILLGVYTAPIFAGPAAPRWSERLPLVVSRTVGSARCADPINIWDRLFIILEFAISNLVYFAFSIEMINSNTKI